MRNLDLSILWGHYGVLLLEGLLLTLQLAAWSLIFSVAIGLVFGVLRWARVTLAGPICWLYLEVGRTVPPLVQLLFWYFSAIYIFPTNVYDYMRHSGYEFAAAVAALSIYHGTFFAEIFRAGLNSVPKGQVEAARSLGLSFGETMWFVALPQALRVIILPLTNEAVGLVKNTSLAMAIGVTEITHSAKTIDSEAFRGVEALMGATVLYLVICVGLSGLGQLASAWLSGPRRSATATRVDTCLTM
jgi:polar amino acid transport system permease protein